VESSAGVRRRYRHADRAADQKRHEARPLYCVAQFPYRDTLNDQAERDDQCRGLCRRQEMQPHRSRDDAEGKTGKAGDKGRGKRPHKKRPRSSV